MLRKQAVSVPDKPIYPGKGSLPKHLEFCAKKPTGRTIPLVFYRLFRSSVDLSSALLSPFLPFPSLASPVRGFDHDDNHPTTARVLQSMNSSAAFPKAAALPARLLRTQQCSAQISICSSAQKRGYHAPASASPARRLREGVYKRNNPVGSSVRVGSFPF